MRNKKGLGEFAEYSTNKANSYGLITLLCNPLGSQSTKERVRLESALPDASFTIGL